MTASATLATCVWLGLRNETDNPFEQRNAATTTGTGPLAVSELARFALLFGAFLVSRF
jgi:hypothetical protein